MSTEKMPDNSTEKAKMSEMYGIDANHEDDLKNQLEKMAAFESAAETGDWKLFKQIVNQSGSLFLKLMRSADGDTRLRLPLFQSGELEDSFSRSLRNLNRDWTSLMPWWARLGYRFEVGLTWISVLLALGAVGAATTSSPGLGGILGAVALAILVWVDNADPGVRSYTRWWSRLVNAKPKSILSRWRTASYVVAILMVMWFLLAPTFKTTGDYCDGLSPADRAVIESCHDPDPFLD